MSGTHYLSGSRLLVNVAGASVASVVASSYRHASEADARTWFDFDSPSARWGNVNDLVVLKALYPDNASPEPIGWGLKEFGYLFCLHGAVATNAERFLDVGVGCGAVLNDWLPESVDSWALDEPGYYAKASFDAGVARRTRTTFRPGLLGQPGHGLPEGTFSVIGSISVLEHAFDDLGPDATFDERLARAIACCEDMRRLLKPDGVGVHTIDVPITVPWIGEVWAKALVETGFVPEENIDMRDRQLDMYEPLSIQHTYYYGAAAESLTFPVRKTFSRTRTLLIIARPS